MCRTVPTDCIEMIPVATATERRKPADEHHPCYWYHNQATDATASEPKT